jgi:hypothetical protein
MTFMSIANWPENIVRCLLTGTEATYINGNQQSRIEAEAEIFEAQGAAIDAMVAADVLLPIDDKNDLRVLQQRYAEFLEL